MTIQQRLKRLEEKVSSRNQKKRKLKESGDISLEEYFEPGSTILPHRVKQWQNDDSYIDFLIENNISFCPYSLESIQEIHLVSDQSFLQYFLENPTEVGWPVIEYFEGKIKFSANAGGASMDYIVCNKATVSN